MSKAQSTTDLYDGLVINPESLSRNGVNAVRVTFGLLGLLSIALGIVLFVWPGATVMVVAGLVAVSFVLSGITRVGFGIFSRGMSGGARTLNLVLGLVVLIAGVVILKNLQSSTELLVVIVVIFIGIGWIIEGVVTLVTSGRAESKGLAWVGGIIGILAGIVLIAMPIPSATFLVVFTGVVLLILGLVSVVRAFTFGKDSKVIEA